MTAQADWAEQILSCKDDENLTQILSDQEESIKIYKKATDQLTAFNDFSTARFTQIQRHLETHTKLIKEIKNDLDAAFLKIRVLKQHCQERHPAEHEKALERYPPRVVEDD
ncbi:hypothetical protein BC943DRAFT_325380 [Umbelopsis sp. AD052]|nr:hypothetical protein BC943DRAFT_325380 [Umbelopsis sp. AD052]